MVSTYNCTSVRAISKFRDSISSLAIIQEDLVIRTHTCKIVSGWSISNILYEFAVSSDSLIQIVKSDLGKSGL